MPKCSPHSLSMHMVDQCLLAIYRQCCIQFQFTLTSALYYFHEIYYNDSPGIAPAYLKIKPPQNIQDFEIDPPSTMAAGCHIINPPPPPPTGNKRPAPLYKGYFKRGGGTLK